jgi:hypothetical protein
MYIIAWGGAIFRHDGCRSIPPPLPAFPAPKPAYVHHQRKAVDSSSRFVNTYLTGSPSFHLQVSVRWRCASILFFRMHTSPQLKRQSSNHKEPLHGDFKFFFLSPAYAAHETNARLSYAGLVFLPCVSLRRTRSISLVGKSCMYVETNPIRHLLR